MSALTAAVVRVAAAGLHRARLTKPVSRMAGYLSRVPRFPILSYHRVNDERDPFFPSLPTEVFERHMAFVSAAYVVLPLEELVERMARGRVPRNALAITFDDGYRDNLTHAAPVLARHGLPATVFLATGVIGTGRGAVVRSARPGLQAQPGRGLSRAVGLGGRGSARPQSGWRPWAARFGT